MNTYTMVYIGLDSSTEVCSAGLLEDHRIIAERLNPEGSNHAALLPTYVQELQAEAANKGLKIDGIVLSEGPGSYTGLRIGASLAKGFCYGTDKPLLSVPTLSIMAHAALAASEAAILPEDLICPMIDARRMEVYCALYDSRLHIVQPLAPVVVNADSFAELLEQHVIWFCGNGANKCRTTITHRNARWIEGIVPTGAEAARLAITFAERADLIRRIEGKEIAYYEPNYLKEFIAAPSHVKGLH